MAEHLKQNRVEVTHDLVSLRYVSLRKRVFWGGECWGEGSHLKAFLDLSWAELTLTGAQGLWELFAYLPVFYNLNMFIWVEKDP